MGRGTQNSGISGFVADAPTYRKFREISSFRPIAPKIALSIQELAGKFPSRTEQGIYAGNREFCGTHPTGVKRGCRIDLDAFATPRYFATLRARSREQCVTSFPRLVQQPAQLGLMTRSITWMTPFD
jgi:hypothetical protein